MAQRLEAALRKPGETTAPAIARPAPAETMLPPPPPPRPAAKPVARTDLSAEARSAKADAKPNQGNTGKTALYDSLEQEMASLLGRPTKT
jgi:hypothetical protein